LTFFKVDNLSISFGGLEALKDITFEVQKGTIFSIIGPNGAGKTTLFNCINGIYRPGSGRIIFKDREIQGKKPDRIARRGIARTFQNIELFTYMNTMENLMLWKESSTFRNLKTLFRVCLRRWRRSSCATIRTLDRG